MTVVVVLSLGLGRAMATTMDRGDGTETQDWFKNTSFLDLPEDLAEATGRGRLFAVVWEQPNCPACDRLHNVNLVKPALKDYVSTNYDIMVLNIFGEVEVTDFDGQKMPEKKLAVKHKVNFTPTTSIFDGSGKEVFRMPGYFEPFYYLAGFVYVKTGGHAKPDATFTRWLKENRPTVEGIYSTP
ncbi:MAG: thioredoxin family protein [Alphaproteobacteria bacterium]